MDKMQPCIVGLHIGGLAQANFGVGEIVTIEAIRELQNSIPGEKPLIHSVEAYAMEFPHSVSEQFLKDIDYPAKIEYNAQSIRLAENTALKPSKVVGILQEPVNAPAVLSPKDPRCTTDSPLHNGMLKFMGEPPTFNPIHIRKVKNYLQDLYMPLKPLRVMDDILSIEEAVHPPLLPCYERVNIHSSPGYPYVLTRPDGVSGSMYMFDEIDDHLYLTDETLRANVNKLCWDGQQGIYHPTIFTATLKDERRPLAKINKPRVFTAGSKEFTLHHRRHLLDFIAALGHNRVQIGHGVGTNCTSMDWAVWYHKLTQFGGQIIAGDHHAFDGMVSPQVFGMLFDVIADWNVMNGMPESHRGCIECLKQDHIHANVLVKDAIYSLFKGEPSGSPSTAPFNTEYNRCLMLLAFLGLAEENKIRVSCEDFDKKCFCLPYGDDILLAVHPDFQQWYNMITLQNWFLKRGLEFTDPQKTTLHCTKPFADISEVTFLKRYFKVDNEYRNIIKAPLEKQALDEIPNWIRKSGIISEDEATRQNCEVTLREYAQYSRAEFEKVKILFNQRLHKLDIAPLMLQYDEIIQECYFNDMF